MKQFFTIFKSVLRFAQKRRNSGGRNSGFYLSFRFCQILGLPDQPENTSTRTNLVDCYRCEPTLQDPSSSRSHEREWRFKMVILHWPLSSLAPFRVIKLNLKVISRHLYLSYNENKPYQIIGSREKIKFSEPYFYRHSRSRLLELYGS